MRYLRCVRVQPSANAHHRLEACATVLELVAGALTARVRMSKTCRDFQPSVAAPPSFLTTDR